jgi:uncharacterized membrane protein YgcG
MKTFGLTADCPRPPWVKRSWVSLLSLALLFAAGGSLGQKLSAAQTAPAPAPAYQPQSSSQLQQAVAPLALYPDSLVAQVLAASTFPEQVVEADRWVQANPDLKGDALGRAVDQQPWDPSVKALTAFPSVLGNMDKNLSWTSSLGDAYYNQPQDVMDAVQAMRGRAQSAGTLRSTPQQTVSTQGPAIVIQPADPNIVYVPAYDPWTDYGAPVTVWPGWYPYPGIWFAGPTLSFGLGFGVGFFGGYAWGSPHWGFDWHNRSVMYNHNRYSSRSNTFYNRNNFYRNGGGPGRGGARPGGGGGARPGGGGGRAFGGNPQGARGFGESRGQSGVRSGAFSDYQHGGEARGASSRGSSSMGQQGARGGGAGQRGGGAGQRGGGGGMGQRGGGGGGRGGGGGKRSF